MSVKGDEDWIELSALPAEFRQYVMVTAERSNASVCRVLAFILPMLNYTSQRHTVTPADRLRDDVSYYMMGVGGTLVCALGLVGNALSLIVITFRLARNSTYTYLSALAVSDSLMLLSSAMLFAKDWRRGEADQGGSSWYPHYFPYVHPAGFTCQVLSIWLTLAFTVDRYIMICHPFDGARMCTVGRARKVVVGLIICAIVFNLPKFFEYRTATLSMCRLATDGSATSAVKVVADLTPFGRSHVFLELYHTWFYLLFVCALPLLVLVLLNSALFRAVRQSRRRHAPLSASDQKNNDTTVMLIAVVVIFFLCQAPALASHIIWAVVKDPKEFRSLHLFLINELGNMCIILNSAVNFLPYYFFGKRFRAEFRRQFSLSAISCCHLTTTSKLPPSPAAAAILQPRDRADV